MELKPSGSEEKQQDNHEENGHLQGFDSFEGHQQIIDNKSHDYNVQDIENRDILQIDQKININTLP